MLKTFFFFFSKPPIPFNRYHLFFPHSFFFFFPFSSFISTHTYIHTHTMSSEHHRQLIASLYRQSLRQARSWINKRDLYRAKAVEIRQQFQENLDERDPRRIHYLVGRTQALLKKYNHPDPIIPPQRPGGTKYERNVFPPQEERKSTFYFILSFFSYLCDVIPTQLYISSTYCYLLCFVFFSVAIKH